MMNVEKDLFSQLLAVWCLWCLLNLWWLWQAMRQAGHPVTAGCLNHPNWCPRWVMQLSVCPCWLFYRDTIKKTTPLEGFWLKYQQFLMVPIPFFLCLRSNFGIVKYGSKRGAFCAGCEWCLCVLEDESTFLCSCTLIYFEVCYRWEIMLLARTAPTGF